MTPQSKLFIKRERGEAKLVFCIFLTALLNLVMEDWNFMTQKNPWGPSNQTYTSECSVRIYQKRFLALFVKQSSTETKSSIVTVNHHEELFDFLRKL